MPIVILLLIILVLLVLVIRRRRQEQAEKDTNDRLLSVSGDSKAATMVWYGITTTFITDGLHLYDQYEIAITYFMLRFPLSFVHHKQ